MPEREIWPYIIAGIVSIWAGAASYIRKLRLGLFRRFSFAELIGEITISGFVGFITFLICQENSLGSGISAAITGICAHMGSRAIFMMEMAMDNILSTAADRIKGERNND